MHHIPGYGPRLMGCILNEQEKSQMKQVKDMGLDFHNFIDGLGMSSEVSLAKTRVEEAVMWATKHLTRG